MHSYLYWDRFQQSYQQIMVRNSKKELDGLWGSSQHQRYWRVLGITITDITIIVRISSATELIARVQLCFLVSRGRFIMSVGPRQLKNAQKQQAPTRLLTWRLQCQRAPAACWAWDAASALPPTLCPERLFTGVFHQLVGCKNEVYSFERGQHLT